MFAAGSDFPKVMDIPIAPQKLRIAFVYSRLPFPMMRGDQLTVSHLLSFLAARGHQVDFYTLREGGEMTEAQLAWLRNTCRSVAIYEHGTARKLLGLIRGVIRGLPAQVAIFSNSDLQRDLHKATRAGSYDVVYAYYIRSAEMVPCESMRLQGTGAPISFLAMQLSQTLNTRRIYQNQSGFKKLLYFVELKLLERYESRIWRNFNRSALIGPKDVEAIREGCRRQGIEEINNWIYSAHGTDVARFRAATAAEVVPNRVVFSGSMLYAPNVQAAKWFVQNCWPAVRRRYPTAELIIQGRDPVPEIKKLHGQSGITVTGTVPDVGEMIRSASVCINPMLAAGGMQNKLIEYFASGKAVVATSIANEGIGAVPDTHFLEANNAEDFSENVLRLLDDPELQFHLGQNARLYALENWTWEAHFLKLESHFLEALAERNAEASSTQEVVATQI